MLVIYFRISSEQFRGEKGRLEKMEITWSPLWYGLDQAIVAGDIDYYYLSNDIAEFANGEVSAEDQEVYAKIVKIIHPEIGKVRGILTDELSYRVFLEDGDIIRIDAEENTGLVEYPADCGISEWTFEVELEILKFTGYSSEQRMTLTADKELQVWQAARKAKYNCILVI